MHLDRELYTHRYIWNLYFLPCKKCWKTVQKHLFTNSCFNNVIPDFNSRRRAWSFEWMSQHRRNIADTICNHACKIILTKKCWFIHEDNTGIVCTCLRVVILWMRKVKEKYFQLMVSVMWFSCSANIDVKSFGENWTNQHAQQRKLSANIKQDLEGVTWQVNAIYWHHNYASMLPHQCWTIDTLGKTYIHTTI